MNTFPFLHHLLSSELKADLVLFLFFNFCVFCSSSYLQFFADYLNLLSEHSFPSNLAGKVQFPEDTVTRIPSTLVPSCAPGPLSTVTLPFTSGGSVGFSVPVSQDSFSDSPPEQGQLQVVF